MNPTRALIYARRSTAEHQAASLDVQTDEARRFCEARGWSVVDVLTEDAVSRAEFVNRPALARLLVLAASKPRPFDVLVTRDESRIGGDLWRTGMVLQNLADADVAVWYYATAERVSFDDPHSKVMAAVRLYASELERLKIAGRCHEALAHRHRAGFNVGGRCYGYDNVRVGDRTEYRINPEQAAVVVDIFERHARGEGVRGIAKALNALGVASPRHGTRTTGSWAPSAVHSMLRNERYRGVLVWGKTGSVYRGGTRVPTKRDDAAVMRTERPELAIVSADLWERAHARSTKTTGRKVGPDPVYLLSGLGRCTCGGPIHATNSTRGRQTIKVYACSWNRSRGPTVCPVTLRRPVEAIDRSVIGWIKLNLMKPAVVEAILAGLRQRLEAGSAPPDNELAEARGSLARTEAEIRRLTAAIVSQDDPSPSLVAALSEREGRVAGLRATVAALAAREAPPAPSWGAVEASVREGLRNLDQLFDGTTAGARKAISALLRGPMLFEPQVVPDGGGSTWRVTAPLRLPGVVLLSDPRQGCRLCVRMRA